MTPWLKSTAKIVKKVKRANIFFHETLFLLTAKKIGNRRLNSLGCRSSRADVRLTHIQEVAGGGFVLRSNDQLYGDDAGGVDHGGVLVAQRRFDASACQNRTGDLGLGLCVVALDDYQSLLNHSGTFLISEYLGFWLIISSTPWGRVG